WWRYLLGVDRHHDALIAELLRRLLDESAARHRSSVDGHLVGARSEELADVLDRANATPDSQRHETGFGGGAHHVQYNVAVLVACGDVEKGELVGAGGIIGDPRGDRISGIAQIGELAPLDHPAILDVEAGNEGAFNIQIYA